MRTPRTRPPTKMAARCSCMHATDTAAWHGKRRSGAGLTGRGAANHTDPRCVHSELQRTLKPLPKKRTIQRVRL